MGFSPTRCAWHGADVGGGSPLRAVTDRVLNLQQKRGRCERSWHAGDVKLTGPSGGVHAMTRIERKSDKVALKELLGADEDYLRTLVAAVVETTLEAEMAAALGAEKGERTQERLGYRSGYYRRSLVTRVGTLELRVPQDREGLFSTRLFERYQRSEKALVGALAEMYVQGVSTRKVKAITEELCGHSFRSERTQERLGYRSGYYRRSLVTRVGTLELRVPQDREGLFSTRLFERYQRSEKALVGALAEMYVQGVSTRKVKAITEELCGHSF